MKKYFAICLVMGLTAVLTINGFAQPKKKKGGQAAGQRTGAKTVTPGTTVKKPTNNSTDSVADYNRPAARGGKQQGTTTRKANTGQNNGLQDVIISSRKPGKNNSNTQSANSANAPTKPCNQLSGTDWLYKGRKCTLPNGQVTTVGAYEKSQKGENAVGGDRAARRGKPAGDPNAATGTGETLRPGGRKGQNANGGARRRQSGQQSEPETNQYQPNSQVSPADLKSSTGIGNGTPPRPGEEIQANGQRQPTAQGPINTSYPERPEDIVTYYQGRNYTSTDPGWEFVDISIGIGVRRLGQAGTVVAHMGCGNDERYTLDSYHVDGVGRVVWCKPNNEQLPKKRPSVAIVPQGQ